MADMSAGYVEGYRRAAELLVRHVSEANRDHDILVYPICYLLRHHFELQLKQIIVVGRWLNNEAGKHPTHHKLEDLWPLAKGILRKCAPHEADPKEFRQLDEYIDQFSAIDPDAQAFRFPRSISGQKSLGGLTHINLSRFHATAESLSSFLSGCEAWLSECLQQKCEMERDFEW